ncbi:MAG: 50S ribosomal protein L19 [Patescibacteria group bacterium]|jgi:large subunit ribosomal protein L19
MEEAAKPQEQKVKKAELPKLKPGNKVRVHQRIKEGKKERTQIFEGMIIAIKGATPETKTITVRKMSEGVSVEKIFPLALPTIEKIEVTGTITVRRAKLYYLRDYKKKVKDKK